MTSSDLSDKMDSQGGIIQTVGIRKDISGITYESTAL